MQKSQKVSLVLKNRIQQFLQHDEDWHLVREQQDHLLFKNQHNTVVHLYANNRVLIQGVNANLVVRQLFIDFDTKHKVEALIEQLQQLVHEPSPQVNKTADLTAIRRGLQDFYITFYDHKHLLTFFGPWNELELSTKMLRMTAQTLKWWINNCKGVRHAGHFNLTLLAPGILTCIQVLMTDY